MASQHTTRSAQENKQSARDAYAAFIAGDAEGAMRDVDDSIDWTVRGHNALTGTHHGKEAVGRLWQRFMESGFSTEPHDFIAEGDKVVVLVTAHLGGEAIESADVLTYSPEGTLIAFDTLADETVPDRVFPK
jgi:ketosteroid isomerase-like protein